MTCPSAVRTTTEDDVFREGRPIEGHDFGEPDFRHIHVFGVLLGACTIMLETLAYPTNPHGEKVYLRGMNFLLTSSQLGPPCRTWIYHGTGAVHRHRVGPVHWISPKR